MLKGLSLQYFVVGSVFLNMINSGLHVSWTSPFLSQLESDPNVGLTKDGGSWIAVGFTIGGTMGAVISGGLIEARGRKGAMVVSASLSIVSWLVLATVRLGYGLFLGRLIAGIGNGIASVVIPVYLTEVCDSPVGRTSTSLLNTPFFIGALVVNVSGYCWSLTVVSLFCAFLPLAFLVMCQWLPESPVYLAKVNASNLKEVTYQIKGQGDAEPTTYPHFPFSRLFTDKAYRNSLIMCMGVIVVQQCSGIVPLMFYTQTVLFENIEDLPPVTFAVIFYLALIAVSIVPTIAIGQDDRLLKPPVIGVGLCLLMEGIYLYVVHKHLSTEIGYPWVKMGIILFFVICYCLGLQTVPFTLIDILFPIHAKAAATCVCVGFLNCVASVIVKLFQFLFDNHDMYVPFVMCASFSFVSLVFVTCFISRVNRGEVGSDLELRENVVPA
ncbi:facilitated trehalose transporter Tret1-like [Photinus pyralis]|uniref:facilitated trehalose transporter Tret1-like n=1 Tax=Photinus pyralis TaxID=7054 RepID=UPI001266E832|nr:facilitated trehalose transporter Tret1-like [Photinus pyralis]